MWAIGQQEGISPWRGIREVAWKDKKPWPMWRRRDYGREIYSTKFSVLNWCEQIGSYLLSIHGARCCTEYETVDKIGFNLVQEELTIKWERYAKNQMYQHIVMQEQINWNTSKSLLNCTYFFNFFSKEDPQIMSFRLQNSSPLHMCWVIG